MFSLLNCHCFVETFVSGLSSKVFEKFYSKPIGKLKMMKLFVKAVSLSWECGVKLEGEFSNLVISAILIEGLVRKLDPTINLVSLALPHIPRMITYLMWV